MTIWYIKKNRKAIVIKKASGMLSQFVLSHGEESRVGSCKVLHRNWKLICLYRRRDGSLVIFTRRILSGGRGSAAHTSPTAEHFRSPHWDFLDIFIRIIAFVSNQRIMRYVNDYRARTGERNDTESFISSVSMLSSIPRRLVSPQYGRMQ